MTLPRASTSVLRLLVPSASRTNNSRTSAPSELASAQLKLVAHGIISRTLVSHGVTLKKASILASRLLVCSDSRTSSKHFNNSSPLEVALAQYHLVDPSKISRTSASPLEVASALLVVVYHSRTNNSRTSVSWMTLPRVSTSASRLLVPSDSRTNSRTRHSSVRTGTPGAQCCRTSRPCSVRTETPGPQ